MKHYEAQMTKIRKFDCLAGCALHCLVISGIYSLGEYEHITFPGFCER